MHRQPQFNWVAQPAAPIANATDSAIPRPDGPRCTRAPCWRATRLDEDTMFRGCRRREATVDSTKPEARPLHDCFAAFRLASAARNVTVSTWRWPRGLQHAELSMPCRRARGFFLFFAMANLCQTSSIRPLLRPHLSSSILLLKVGRAWDCSAQALNNSPRKAGVLQRSYGPPTVAGL